MSPIHIDVTELLANELHTGIQRVVRQIVEKGIDASPGSMIPMIAVHGRFYALNAAGLALLHSPPDTSAGARLTDGGIVTRFVKAALASVPPLYDWAQRRYFERKLNDRLKGMIDPAPLALRHGDQVVLIDSFWGGSTTLVAARRARSQGCTVVAVVYDMIPVTHPQFASAQLARAFAPAILKAARICTGFVTISKYCEQVIENFLRERNLTLPVSSFYLGADLVRDPGPTCGADLCPNRFGDDRGRLHIMVGTIEPRKSHAVVIDAFELLWQQGREDRLLVVGKIGWDVEALMARLNSHPELGRRLILMHGASDAVLAQAFDCADAAIMASSVEGFGLPLVEALFRKVPVIASDIPVFREIAGASVLYFTLDDTADLASAVVTMERNAAEFRAAAAAFEWISWDQAVTQFRVAVRTVAASSALAASG